MSDFQLNLAQLQGRDIKAAVFKGYFQYIQKYFSTVNLEEVCKAGGIDSWRVESSEEWLTIDEAERLTKKLLMATGDPDLSRRAGHYGMTKEALGSSLFLSLKYLISVSKLYDSIQHTVARFNSFLNLSIQKGAGWRWSRLVRVEIKPSFLESEKASIYIAHLEEVIKNLVGYFETAPTIKGLPSAKVEVKKCYGGKAPYYEILVRYSDISIRSLFPTLGVLAVPAILWNSHFNNWIDSRSAYFLVIVFFGLAATYFWRRARVLEALLEAQVSSFQSGTTKDSDLGAMVDMVKSAIPLDMIKLAGASRVRDLVPGFRTQRDLSVLLLDIVGYSQLCEELGEDSTVEWLMDLYRHTNQIVIVNGGTLDKYIGDSFLCFFSGGTEQAIRVARDILEVCNSLNQSPRFDRPYSVRIGIDFGSVMIAVLGSDDYFEITGIGKVVNSAARLESINKKLGSQILMSRAALDNVDNNYRLGLANQIRFVGSHAGKENETPIDCYEVSSSINVDFPDVELFESIVRDISGSEQQRGISELRKFVSAYPLDSVASYLAKKNK